MENKNSGRVEYVTKGKHGCKNYCTRERNITIKTESEREDVPKILSDYNIFYKCFETCVEDFKILIVPMHIVHTIALQRNFINGKFNEEIQLTT